MPSDPEPVEQLEELLVELRERNRISPIIVEGKKDVRSLRQLGIEGEIIVLNRGMSMIQFAEMELSRYREVILLTDWDRTGGRLARSLRTYLDGTSTRYDLEFRKRLRSLCQREIKDIESLATHYFRLQNEKGS